VVKVSSDSNNRIHTYMRAFETFYDTSIHAKISENVFTFCQQRDQIRQGVFSYWPNFSTHRIEWVSEWVSEYFVHLDASHIVLVGGGGGVFLGKHARNIVLSQIRTYNK